MSEFNLESALRRVRERNASQGIKPLPTTRIDPNSPQSRIARASQQEHDLIEEMHFLRHQPDSDLKERRLAQIFDRLGELAAEQGDYSKAAAISHSPERREHYKDINAAIKRDDSETCDCPHDLIVDRANGKEFQSPAVMTVQQIMTKDGLKNLDVCRKCGDINTR